MDVLKLVASRAVLTANSGSGKSWAIRRLLEQSHGLVQQLIIDPEGDFVTLREKYDDYVLVAVGDIEADPSTARVLARRLLNVNLSAIIDLSDMPLHRRFEFVGEFLGGLMEAPREDWHPVQVVIDEAHEFAPQQANPPCKRAVIDLMTRGRKRGYGGVLATQRLAVLDNNAAAQASNRLIGNCSMAADRKRAAEDLGLGRAEQGALAELDVGEFCVMGPAISRRMVRVKVGGVETPHGFREGAVRPAPPSLGIKEVLPQLVALLGEGIEMAADPDPEGAKAEDAVKGRGRARPTTTLAPERPSKRTGSVDRAAPPMKEEHEGSASPRHGTTRSAASVAGLPDTLVALGEDEPGVIEITVRLRR